MYFNISNMWYNGHFMLGEDHVMHFTSKLTENADRGGKVKVFGSLTQSILQLFKVWGALQIGW